MEELKPIHITDKLKGIVLIVAGIVLLFHVLGIFPSIINVLLILGSLYLIILGLHKTQYHKQLLILFDKDRK